MQKLVTLLALAMVAPNVAADDFHSNVLSRRDDLRLSTYVMAQSAADFFENDADGLNSISILRGMGITKAYVEVYRSGLVVDQAQLERVRDHLLDHDIAVAGGIATTPGDDFGVRQEGRLNWFNWQNAKTQDDLRRVMQMSARVFDEFIIDDFLCTDDVSDESRQAKGDRSWSEYRRDLLVELSRTVFIDPARAVNPDITMIIKYPQWYDRFHLFGYDVAHEPALFDSVWVGTETRGARTRRYGYVQPYEGFVNYRWLSAVSGGKVGGAWFDHGDCDAQDFLEQAYQTVLAGAREIVIFHYGDLVQGHGGQELVRRDFNRLADLARAVRTRPVQGVAAYKPPNSDAGGDMYIMDYIGMLGVPLVPHSSFPDDAPIIFLPTQAAADPSAFNSVKKAATGERTIIMTAGFLASMGDIGAELAGIAGLERPVKKAHMNVAQVYDGENLISVEHGLDLEATLEPVTAETLLHARAEGRDVPFLTRHNYGKTKVYVLNTHTFSQADFDAVGEVLLAPRPLGLLELPRSWANTLRAAFNAPLGIILDAPTRVTLQPLGDAGYVIHNYNLDAVTVVLSRAEGFGRSVTDGFTGDAIHPVQDTVLLDLPPRSVRWLRIE